LAAYHCPFVGGLSGTSNQTVSALNRLAQYCAAEAVELRYRSAIVFEASSPSWRCPMPSETFARPQRLRAATVETTVTQVHVPPPQVQMLRARVTPPATHAEPAPGRTSPAAQPAPAPDTPAGKSGKGNYPCIEIAPRSVWIGSRRTSIRLEPEFWTALGEISREQRSTISGVLLDIERIHGRSRFASKVRVAILSYYRR
jgi:predicted DNA-binding ribbon-helix-helix protein